MRLDVVCSNVFHIQPGDTLLILGDEKKGLAIPPKNMLSKFTQMIFDTSSEEE